MTACHLHQPPDRFARSAQWPRLPPLSSSLPLAADSLSAAAAAVAAAVAAAKGNFRFITLFLTVLSYTKLSINLSKFFDEFSRILENLTVGLIVAN